LLEREGGALGALGALGLPSGPRAGLEGQHGPALLQWQVLQVSSE
jgi:hypothetical protein